MPSLVSIGIPCYNAGRWLAAAVQSALDQTWTAKEVIVVDDGSTDGSLGVLRGFGDAITVIRASHGGANRARNLILKAARGEWIQYLDADDYLQREKIERQFAEAGSTEEVDVIYSPILLETWRDGRPLPPVAEPLDATADIYTQLLRWQLPQTSGALWRRAALDAIGGWDENPTQLCDEHDCYFRALKAGRRFVFAPTANAVYRIWSEETRSHGNQRPVILSRTALCEALRDWLLERGKWTDGHREVLGQSLLEMARKLASEDIEFAARYQAAHKADICLAGPAAPKAYQLVYRALGFKAAETGGARVEMKPLMLLSTLHGNHAKRSGYQALAAYLPEGRFLHTIRADPPGGVRLLGAQLARRVSFSRWYLGGCAALEAQAWRELRGGFSGIVHSMWADHDLGFLDLLLDRRRHRLVGSFHNCDDTFVHTIRFPGRLRGFDAIILMSRTQERFFLEAGVKPERIHVVRHGVDTECFRPGAMGGMGRMGGMGGMFTVLAAGGYRRNFPLLREVCLRLKDEPGVRFEIVAPAAWHGLFEDLPNARFRSGLNDAEFLEAYQDCSCLLQTVENATANNVILEAMACGKPVVAESVGGIPEYVDGSCGILTGCGDSEGLAAGVMALYGDTARRETLGAGARKRAEMLDWNNVAGRMREIYEGL